MRILEIIAFIVAAAAVLLMSGSLVLDVVKLIKVRQKHAREAREGPGRRLEGPTLPQDRLSSEDSPGTTGNLDNTPGDDDDERKVKHE